MSDHPSIDALQAHLAAPDAALRAHLAGCAECTRLLGGLAALDEARRHTPVPPPWERLDDVLAREAQRVSQEIRSGRLKASPRAPSWVATGLAMAAGVGLLLGGRALLQSRGVPVDAPVVARPTPAPAPAPSPAPTLTPYEAVVLLAAGGARYHERANDEGSLLSRSTGLREGASVETSATARAVFTVRPGWTADVRSGSSIELSQLRTEQTAVTLGRGALAMTPAPGGSGPVRVLHGGWSVESHGPVVARVESSVLRVVVLSGRTDIRRGEAEALTVTGPLVIDLPLDGGAPTRTELTANDPAALDLAALSAQGTSFAIPAIDPSATLTLLDHGALPSALESIRLAGPGTIQARVGRSEMRLELGAGATPRWATFRSAAPARGGLQPGECGCSSRTACRRGRGHDAPRPRDARSHEQCASDLRDLHRHVHGEGSLPAAHYGAGGRRDVGRGAGFDRQHSCLDGAGARLLRTSDAVRPRPPVAELVSLRRALRPSLTTIPHHGADGPVAAP
jgi:hypothetical protein